MRFTSIILWIVIIAGVCIGGPISTEQESGRDAIYSRFEEYDAATPQGEIRARLDALAEHLKMNSSLTAILISYGARESCRDEALLRARLVSRYLSTFHGVSSNRVKIRNGGYREDWGLELWVGSANASPPRAAKTINRRFVTIKGQCKLTPISSSP